MTTFFRNSVLLAISVLAVIISISCSGSSFSEWLDNVLNPPDKDNVLQNSNLGFMGNSAPIPEGDVSAITSLDIAGNVLSGGSVFVTVTSSKKLEDLYLQIEGENGHYVWELEPEDQISSNPYVYQVALEFNIDLGERTTLKFTVGGKTESGDYVKLKSKDLKIINVGSGAMQVSLSWDKYDDVDLHVYSPSGKHLYFGNKREANAELDIDSNAGCHIDGVNSENIFFEAPLEDGDYKVKVHMFMKCKFGEGDTKFRVTANLEGKFVEFSKQQSGYFTDEMDDEFLDIGTIKIRNGKCSNCSK
ncbi:MAG: hypothetical protein LBC87_03030 [Fibromonadaceae bacterium]|jgi:uncharacterized protein YxeA|nr:hypothetical protein [Fibromonadaceae bacterium]